MANLMPDSGPGSGLDAAQARLDSLSVQTPDVAAVLAKKREHEERSGERAREVKEKLEAVHEAARRRSSDQKERAERLRLEGEVQRLKEAQGAAHGQAGHVPLAAEDKTRKAMDLARERTKK